MTHDSLRAYELVAIADGTKTVEGIREANTERNKKYRSTSCDGQPQPPDSVGKNVKQPNNLGGRPVVDELQVVTN